MTGRASVNIFLQKYVRSRGARRVFSTGSRRTYRPFRGTVTYSRVLGLEAPMYL
jgi:hypothetical protein